MPRGLPFIDLGIVLDGLPSSLIGPTATVKGTKELQAKLNHYAAELGSPGRFLRAAAVGYRTYMVTNMLSGQRLKRRSGHLANAWQPQRVSRTVYRVTPGRLPYARVHEYGLSYPFQPVRGYVTKSGRKVRLYTRDMKIKETRYVRDTVILGDKFVQKRLDIVAQSILKGGAQRGKP